MELGEADGPAAESITTDIHCVTRWSKLDTAWRGISVDTLLADVETEADYAMAHSYGGYSTNLPLEDLLDGKVWVAFEYDGEQLVPEHGGPARLLVPHLYFWKSAKWVRGVELMLDDSPGFWEQLGYHDYGDPWREQRYQGDCCYVALGGPQLCESGGRRHRAPALWFSKSRRGLDTLPATIDVRLGWLPGGMQLVGRRPDEGLEVPFIYTGAAPEDQPQPPGRISIGDLASQGWPAELRPTCYVYGPTGFVETVSDLSEFLARCPSCESVLLRMVRTFDALWLDMSGMSALRILMMINSTSESHSR